MVFVRFEYTVRQFAMSEQVDGAAQVLVYPFGRDFRVGMIVERAVYAGDAFYRTENLTDVMTYQNDGAAMIDCFKYLVKFGFEPFVEVRIRLVENHQVGF